MLVHSVSFFVLIAASMCPVQDGEGKGKARDGIIEDL